MPRAAELAVINEIGRALAEQLEFDAIVDLVGERIRTLFRSQSMYIAIYDEAKASISFPYEIDDGVRIQTEPLPYGQGLTSIVIRTRPAVAHRDGRRRRGARRHQPRGASRTPGSACRS